MNISSMQSINAYNALIAFEKDRLQLIAICADSNCPNNTHLPLVIPEPAWGDNPLPYFIYVNEKWHEVSTYVFDKPDDIIQEFGLPAPIEGGTQPFIGMRENGTLIWYIDPQNLNHDMVYRVVTPLLESALPAAINVRKTISHFAKIDEITANISTGLAQVYLERKDAFDQKISLLESDLQLYRSKVRFIENLLPDLKRQQNILSGENRRRFVLAKQSATLLASAIPKDLEDIVIIDKELHLFTSNISLYWNDENFEMGKYIIKIPLVLDDHQDISIDCLGERPAMGRGERHPHVSSGGHCCLGNIDQMVYDLHAQGSLGELGLLLVRFLNSYNDNNPYFHLDNGTDYDGCLEDSSSGDCTSCGDDNCPYWMDRFDRCWSYFEDNDEYTDCIRCGECDFYLDAIKACHTYLENDTEYCVLTCSSISCSYYKNELACWNEHQDTEHCQDICQNMGCKYYVEKIEEEEEEDDV